MVESSIDTGEDTGFERASLTDAEENLLTTFYNRGLQDVRSDRPGVLARMVREYSDAIQVAAEGARAQFNKRFDGQQPASGRYGVSPIHAGYFGYNTWGSFTGPAGETVVDWLDNSAPDNLSGNGGQEGPLSVGESAFHIILGVGDYQDDSSITRVRWRLNDQPRAAINTELQFKNSDLNTAWLDSPVVIGEDDDVYAQVLLEEAEAAASPYLIGLSFLEHKEARRINPADMVGDSRVVSE